jgi:hypothetical protein
MTSSIWEPTLWAYSATLEEHRAVLESIEMDIVVDDEVPMPPPFAAPEDAPPMPDEYVPWARTLLETTDGLISLAKSLALRSELRRAERPHHPLVNVGRGADSTLNALL